MACCPSLNRHFEFFGFVESSALDAKVPVLAFRDFETWSWSGLTSLNVWKHMILTSLWKQSSSLLVVNDVDCFLSWGERFLVAEFRTPSDSRSCWKTKSSQNVNRVCDYVSKANNATGVLVCNWNICVYLLDLRFNNDTRSHKLFCRTCHRLDNMPVSWNAVQKMQLLPDHWG